VIEFTDKKGDRWVVRECDNDDHCVAVERHMALQDGGEKQTDDFHIPLESLGDLIGALKQYDKQAQ